MTAPKHAPRVALCVSGDLNPNSRIIETAYHHMLSGMSDVDLIAFLWAPEGAGEQEIRDWMTPQLNPNIRLRRWSFDTIRPMKDWDKFANANPKLGDEYFERLSRMETALQCVSQLKSAQEYANNQPYDIIVRLEADMNVRTPLHVTFFETLLEDHVITGMSKPMASWWPEYDFRFAFMNSRNFNIYASLHTLHRRQYIVRNLTVKSEAALADHMRHAHLKTCTVPIVLEQCQ